MAHGNVIRVERTNDISKREQLVKYQLDMLKGIYMPQQ
jgi:hypothetical protein